MHERVNFPRTAVFLIAMLVLPAFCLRASAELRVVTYNTKKRPASTDPAHGDTNNWIGALTAVCESESDAGVARTPDIMALQEIPYTSGAFAELGEAPFDSPANIAAMLNEINGVTTYTHMTGSYGDGWNTQGYVWNTATVELLEQTTVSIGTRPAIRMKFRPAGYTIAESEFYIYNVHLKAYPDCESRRLGEVQCMRRDSDNNLGNGVNVIYAGDFNFTEGMSGGERGYDWVLSDGPGKAVDPRGGENTFFDGTYPASSGGGGRIDFQFVTEEVVDGNGFDLMDGGYHVVGPTYIEQLNRYDVVPSSLKFASDHLPVSADYQVPAKMAVDVEQLANPVIVGADVTINVAVENVAPATVATGAAMLGYSVVGDGELVVGTVSGTDAPLGGGNVHALALDASTIGIHLGEVTVASDRDDVESAVFSEAVMLNVFEHSEASFALDADVDRLSLDMGNHVPSSGIRTACFEIHDLVKTPAGASLTADLDLDAVIGTGDTAVLTTDLAPTTIEPVDAKSFRAAIDTASRQGLFTAEYTIRVSDQDLPGAVSGTDLVLELTGYVAIDGDLNLDRRVDAWDLNLLLAHYGLPEDASWRHGDIDGDARVTGDDLALLLANYGVVVTDPPIAAVPEPTSFVLLLFIGASAVLRSGVRRG